MGSIFRTCDGLGVSRLLLGGISCAPPHKEIDKTALGATQSVDWAHYWDVVPALRNLQKEGFDLIACDTGAHAQPIQVLNERISQKGTKIALVFGHEVRGISPEVAKLCSVQVCLPHWGTKNSYNVAVAAGMTIWHIRHIQYAQHQKPPNT